MKKKKANKAMPVPSGKKSAQKKWWMAGIGIASVGVLGYFGWQYHQKKKNADSGAAAFSPADWPDIKPPNNAGNATPTAPVYTPLPKPRPMPRPGNSNATGDAFPLKQGSRGENVRAFQQALINAYGKEVLPRYGADGSFGKELATALQKQGLPPTVAQTLYNLMVSGGGKSGGSGTGQATGAQLAKTLIDAAAGKKFSAAIKALQQITDTGHYTEVNNAFKAMRINGGVRQTLVNGMLNSFPTEAQKRAIRLEFGRMGLQYDGSKWTLGGFDGMNGLPIVTIAATTVWLNATQSVQVPARTVLGNEISRRLDYTLFENKGKHYLVQTAYVTYL